MKQSPNQTAVTAIVRDFDAKTDRLLADTGFLFGTESSETLSLLKLVEDARQIWREIETNACQDTAIFTFLKQDDTDPPSLVDLICNEDTTISGPSLARPGAIRWVGPKRPPSMNAQQEAWKRLDPEKMPDLGASCLFVETPSLNGLAEDRVPTIRRLTAGAAYKIIELREERIEPEKWQDCLSGHKGAVVLPVIRLTSKSTQDYEKGTTALMNEWSNHILPGFERKMPGVHLLHPIALPHLQAMGDEKKAREIARETMTDALRRMLQQHPLDAIDRRAELEASWEEFVLSAADHLKVFKSPLLRQRDMDLEACIGSLPEEAIDLLISEERRLRSLFRIHLRDELVSQIPDLAFPFKSVTGLLCLTAGAWDKLILASSGSLPSAVMVAAKSIKNRIGENNARQQLVAGVETRVHTMARTSLTMPWNDFISALEKITGQTPKSDEGGLPTFTIEGVETFVSNWQAGLETAYTASSKTRAIPVRLIAYAASTLFVALILGPLLQVYGQYLTAAYRSLRGQWVVDNLSTYPSPTAAFWFTDLILSLIPVFLLSLILVASYLRKNRVDEGLRNLMEFMDDRLTDGSLGLAVRSSDLRVDASRNLASFANSSRMGNQTQSLERPPQFSSAQSARK